jgi:hypothetical protein
MKVLLVDPIDPSGADLLRQKADGERPKNIVNPEVWSKFLGRLNERRSENH